MYYFTNNNKINKEVVILYGSNDFGKAIDEYGILNGNIGFFLCNKVKNSPLGDGFVIIIGNPNYWKNHPTYIICSGNNISTGTLNCNDLSNITKD